MALNRQVVGSIPTASTTQFNQSDRSNKRVSALTKDNKRRIHPYGAQEWTSISAIRRPVHCQADPVAVTTSRAHPIAFQCDSATKRSDK
jgi:hypothetical protein